MLLHLEEKCLEPEVVVGTRNLHVHRATYFHFQFFMRNYGLVVVVVVVARGASARR